MDRSSTISQSFTGKIKKVIKVSLYAFPSTQVENTPVGFLVFAVPEPPSPPLLPPSSPVVLSPAVTVVSYTAASKQVSGAAELQPTVAPAGLAAGLNCCGGREWLHSRAGRSSLSPRVCLC